MTNELGLQFISEFISEEKEKELLSIIQQYKPIEDQKSHLRNSVWRFGPKHPYHNNNLSNEIPFFLQELADKLVENQISDISQSVSINEYILGNSMPPHIDNQNSGPVITIISLGCESQMKFAKKEESFIIDLPRRSLISMSGEIRNQWTHELLPVPGHRFSIIFRCV
jgi:alkylated DNA repair dioxygenase AlkB